MKPGLTFPFALPLGLLILLLTAGLADAENFQAVGDTGDLALIASPGSPSYLLRGEQRTELPLAEGAVVNDFAAQTIWWAAAVEPSAAGRRLALLRGRGASVERLATPSVADASQLREPVLLLDGDHLAGLAWLEGRAPRRQVLRAAWRSGDQWQEPRTISPAGPGSQMALAAAPLGDGAWLVAWAAFDGEDDEILWSRLAPDGASPPARLAEDNDVPDLTPSLLATGDGGVLAAWSRYDGNDYRVHVARFASGVWSSPRIMGSKGSVDPLLTSGPAGPLLLWERAVPHGWTVAELDSQGIIRRWVELSTPRRERPLVRGVSSTGLSLVWINRPGVDGPSVELAWKDVR